MSKIGLPAMSWMGWRRAATRFASWRTIHRPWAGGRPWCMIRPRRLTMERPIPARMERRYRSRTPISRRRLLAHDRHDDVALARPLVEIAQNDLLPRAEGQTSGGDREALGRSHERAAQVGVAV